MINHAIKLIRWAPVAYYVFAVVWAMLAGTIELDAALQYAGILGSGFYLALAGERGTQVWPRVHAMGTARGWIYTELYDDARRVLDEALANVRSEEKL